MRKLRLTTVLSVALAAAPNSFAQKGIEGAFPARFGQWTATAAAIKSMPRQEDLPLLREEGLMGSFTRPYSNGSQTLTVSLSEFRDPSSAYEAYTSLLKPGQLPTRVGQVAAFSKDHVLIQVGDLVLESTANASRDDLNALVQAVAARSGKAPLPPIPDYLPNDGRVPGSERYALGPLAFRSAAADLNRAEFAPLSDEVGFKLGAEAMLAHYRTRSGEEAVLLLIEYPTPQLAEQHLRHLEQAISPAAKQAGTTIERKASLLSLILKPTSAAYGDSLRNAVKYETEVTWNEPHQTATDPPIINRLIVIILATILFMVAAVVLGAAFGGVRLLTKMLFPGKVFDRPEQMDVLQLGLSGKRINSRDFY